jgi:hypothetical protein
MLESIIIQHGPTVVLWLLGFLGTWLSAVIVSRINEGKVQSLVLRAREQLFHLVVAHFQVAVGPLKEAGRFSSEAKAQAREAVLDEFRSLWGRKGLRVLGAVLDVDVDRWLGQELEAAVAKAKMLGRAGDVTVKPAVSFSDPHLPA